MRNISIEEMVDELKRVGWTAKTSTIWRAPNGALFLGPTGAWRRMRRVMSVQDRIDDENGRSRILQRAMKQRVEIEQIFTDIASWNDNSTARKNGAEPIDPDPDGALRRMADGLDRMLSSEASRG